MHASLRPSRRWFRISLRSLFLLVTVCAATLGWQLHVVHERGRMRQRLESEGAAFWEIPWAPTDPPPPNWGEIPWYRRLLGDEPVAWIVLPSGISPESRSNVDAVFPEALFDIRDP
jgi:hypothetical protein